MNYITTQQEMVDYLREFFKVLNHEIYMGELHDPIINVGTLAGAQKSRYVPYVWSDAKGKKPEIVFMEGRLKCAARDTTITNILGVHAAEQKSEAIPSPAVVKTTGVRTRINSVVSAGRRSTGTALISLVSIDDILCLLDRRYI